MDLHKEQQKFHQNLESRMSIGYHNLVRTVRGSKEEILDELKQILADERATTHTSQLDLLSGQQDLAESLNRVSRNILGAQGESETQLATRMESVLLEQQRATRALLKADVEDKSAAMVAQLHLLVSFETRIKR